MTEKQVMPEFTDEDLAKFDWLTLKKDMDHALPTETTKEKFIRKFKENPMVPIGAFATTAALSCGLWSFRTGRKKMSQYMMRTRIVAQGFTVFAMVMGITAATSQKIK